MGRDVRSDSTPGPGRGLRYFEGEARDLSLGLRGRLGTRRLGYEGRRLEMDQMCVDTDETTG